MNEQRQEQEQEQERKPDGSRKAGSRWAEMDSNGWTPKTSERETARGRRNEGNRMACALAPRQGLEMEADRNGGAPQQKIKEQETRLFCVFHSRTRTTHPQGNNNLKPWQQAAAQEQSPQRRSLWPTPSSRETSILMNCPGELACRNELGKSVVHSTPRY